MHASNQRVDSNKGGTRPCVNSDYEFIFSDGPEFFTEMLQLCCNLYRTQEINVNSENSFKVIESWTIKLMFLVCILSRVEIIEKLKSIIFKISSCFYIIIDRSNNLRAFFISSLFLVEMVYSSNSSALIIILN